MPQLSQLSEVYLSQFLWLAVALGFIFFVIARGMVPKIQATVDAREQRIAGDLEAAQKARAAADETEAAWRARMDSARADAAQVAQEAKAESARDTEARVKAAADKINLKVEAAQGRIRDALESAIGLAGRGFVGRISSLVDGGGGAPDALSLVAHRT